nr:sensor histidine kinase [uncultured Flavobacterium sp.]
MSEQAKDTNAIAKSYYYIGDTYEVSHKDSAYYYYQKAEKLYRNLKNDLMTGRMQFNKAYLLFYEGNYIESEILLSKALQLLKKSDDKKLLYSTYNLMGANFGKLEESDNAIKYYMLAKGVLNDLIQSDDGFDKKNNFKISTSVNLAEIYRQRAQYKKAILELESVLSPNLKKEWPEYYAIIIGNLGEIKMKSGNLYGVEKLLKTSLDISRRNSNEASQIYKLSYLGEYYSIVKDTAKSISYLKQSLRLSEKFQSSDNIKLNLKLLSKIDYKNDSFYTKRYIAISDSLTKVQRNNRNKYARIEYETSIVEDENKSLSTRNLYLIIGSFMIVLVSGGILINRYVENKKRELVYQIQLQKAEEEIFELLKDYQIKLNTIKFKEQNRIAMELHDNVLNKLYGTRLQLGILNNSDTLEGKEKRLSYVDLLQEIELEIRNISHDLHTDDIEVHLDYIDLLNDLIQEKNEFVLTHFSFSDTSNLNWNNIDGLVKITIFRIVQEALLNVIKYAEATTCEISLNKTKKNKLQLLIEDNGKGFKNNTRENDGIGLKNIKERARLVHAELSITSNLGKGTKIEIIFDC